MESLGWVIAEAFQTPSGALEQDLHSGALREALSSLGRQYGIEPPKLSEVSLAKLQAAHVSLFVCHSAGLPAPPYAGYALDQRLFGPSFDRLMLLFERSGLEVSPDWRDLPDHVAALGEALALASGRAPAAARRLALEYLLPWFERFAPVIAACDTSGFYRAVSAFVLEVLREVKREAVAPALS